MCDVRENHHIAILLIIFVASPVADIVIYGVPLLAASVERMVDLHLAIGLVAFGRLVDKLMLVAKRLLFRSEIIALGLFVL